VSESAHVDLAVSIRAQCCGPCPWFVSRHMVLAPAAVIPADMIQRRVPTKLVYPPYRHDFSEIAPGVFLPFDSSPPRIWPTDTNNDACQRRRHPRPAPRHSTNRYTPSAGTTSGDPTPKVPRGSGATRDDCGEMRKKGRVVPSAEHHGDRLSAPQTLKPGTVGHAAQPEVAGVVVTNEVCAPGIGPGYFLSHSARPDRVIRGVIEPIRNSLRETPTRRGSFTRLVRPIEEGQTSPGGSAYTAEKREFSSGGGRAEFRAVRFQLTDFPRLFPRRF